MSFSRSKSEKKKEKSKGKSSAVEAKDADQVISKFSNEFTENTKNQKPFDKFAEFLKIYAKLSADEKSIIAGNEACKVSIIAIIKAVTNCDGADSSLPYFKEGLANRLASKKNKAMYLEQVSNLYDPNNDLYGIYDDFTVKRVLLAEELKTFLELVNTSKHEVRTAVDTFAKKTSQAFDAVKKIIPAKQDSKMDLYDTETSSSESTPVTPDKQAQVTALLKNLPTSSSSPSFYTAPSSETSGKTPFFSQVDASESAERLAQQQHQRVHSVPPKSAPREPVIQRASTASPPMGPPAPTYAPPPPPAAVNSNIPVNALPLASGPQPSREGIQSELQRDHTEGTLPSASPPPPSDIPPPPSVVQTNISHPSGEVSSPAKSTAVSSQQGQTRPANHLEAIRNKSEEMGKSRNLKAEAADKASKIASEKTPKPEASSKPEEAKPEAARKPEEAPKLEATRKIEQAAVPKVPNTDKTTMSPGSPDISVQTSPEPASIIKPNDAPSNFWQHPGKIIGGSLTGLFVVAAVIAAMVVGLLFWPIVAPILASIAVGYLVGIAVGALAVIAAPVTIGALFDRFSGSKPVVNGGDNAVDSRPRSNSTDKMTRGVGGNKNTYVPTSSSPTVQKMYRSFNGMGRPAAPTPGMKLHSGQDV